MTKEKMCMMYSNDKPHKNKNLGLDYKTALNALSEDQGSSLSTHMAAQDCNYKI